MLPFGKTTHSSSGPRAYKTPYLMVQGRAGVLYINVDHELLTTELAKDLTLDTAVTVEGCETLSGDSDMYDAEWQLSSRPWTVATRSQRSIHSRFWSIVSRVMRPNWYRRPRLRARRLREE